MQLVSSEKVSMKVSIEGGKGRWKEGRKERTFRRLKMDSKRRRQLVSSRKELA